MEIVLGNPERAERIDVLRDGAIRIRSRRGLADAERLLIEAVPRRAGSVLCVLDRQGVVALAATELLPGAEIVHADLDAYRARLAARLADAVGRPLRVEPCAHLPSRDGGWDAILLSGPEERLLLRDLVEEAHDALAPGGRLIVAADREPKALVGLVKEVFGAADRQAGERKSAQLVSARRTREKAQRRDRQRIVEREVRGVTLRLASCPGVFAAGRIDPGSRALLQRLEVPEDVRVIDIGCGTGALGIAALLLGASHATLVDSSVRAVEAARQSAAASGIESERIEIALRADLEDLPTGLDLALANPPYFGGYRIAEAFIACAHRSLRRGGRLLLVAKAAGPHADRVRAVFGRATLHEESGYGIVEAVR